MQAKGLLLSAASRKPKSRNATRGSRADQGVRPTADRTKAIFAAREDFEHLLSYSAATRR
jgi:hypothetical protein